MDILSDVNVIGQLKANSVQVMSAIYDSVGPIIRFDTGSTPFGSPTLSIQGVAEIGSGSVGYHTISVMKTVKITVPSGCAKFSVERFCSYSYDHGSNYNNFPIIQMVNLSTNKKVETDLEFILSSETGTPTLDVISSITPMGSSTDFAVSITRLP